jgi:HD-like signal output (HDOD) protein
MNTNRIPDSYAIDSALERTVKDIGIPPRPVILDRIVAEMRKNNPNFAHLAKLISADVSLAGGLIKTVNSPYFGFRNRVRSVDEALMVLGLDVTSRAIAVICLRNSFPVTPTLERFWENSAQIAALSGWLAQKVRLARLRAADAYTYGLFRDVGIPIMFRRFPDYPLVLAEANNETTRSFTEIEHQYFRADHAVVGFVLAKDWWLPEEVGLAICNHHELPSLNEPESRLPEISRYLVAAGQTAEHILQEVTGGSHTCEWPKLGATCLRILEIPADELPNFYAAAGEILEAVE